MKWLWKYFYLLFPLIVLPVIRLGFGFDGLYGQDSYEYVRYCDAWINYLSGGNHPGDYHWPLFFPVFGALIGYVFGLSGAFVLQLLCIISFAGSAVMIKRLIPLIYPERSGKATYWVMVSFLLAPYVFRSGVVCMSDQFAAFLCVTAFYLSVLVVKKEKSWWLLIVLLFGACAVMTRYVTALVMLPIGIYLLPVIWKRRLWLPMLVGLVIAVMPFLPHYFIRMQDVAGFIGHPALVRWSVGNMFSRTFQTDLGSFTFTVPNILYIFHPFVHAGFLFFGAGLFLFIKKIRFSPEVVMILAVILIYLGFIAGVDTQNDRYFITIMPFVVLFTYPLFNAFAEWGSSKLNRLYRPLLIGLLCGQIALTGYAFSKPYLANRSEQELATMFDDFSGKLVYSYGVDVALRHYNKENEFVSLHLLDGLNPDPGTYLLFDHGWLEHPQVKGLFQVSLWKQLQQSDRLESIQHHGSWELYLIH